MKQIKVYLFLLFGLLISSSVNSQDSKGPTMEVVFKTLGNCGMCKYAIENASLNVTGVSEAYWDYTSDQTTITYDTEVTDVHTVMQAIADVGYDTEWYEAPAAAYAELVGTCCEYDRVIDYGSVQIGYLSLMGIWVYPLSVNTLELSEAVKVYPNITGHNCYVEAENEVSFELITMTGKSVMKGTLPDSKMLDLSNLENGTHILYIIKEGEVISINKIIKI